MVRRSTRFVSHRPLLKRGPRVAKRTPLLGTTASERVRRRGVGSGRTCACGRPGAGTGPGAGGDERRRIRARAATETREPAAADSSAITTRKPSRDTKTARAPPDAPTRPRSAPTTRLSPPTCRPSRRLDSSRRSAHSPHPCLTDLHGPNLPAAAPPEATPASRLGWPVQVFLDSRGSGVRRAAADSTSSKAQAGSQGNTRRRGGGLLRSWKKPIERNRWRETQGGKQVSRRRQLSSPAPVLRWSTTPPAMGPSIAFWRTPWCSSGS